MPLPANGTPWPPLPAKLAGEHAAHAAWYSGDRADLARIYGRSNHADTRPSGRRFFWSRPRDLTQRDTRLHVPLAADIATTSADLLFAEPPTFQLPDDAPAGAQDRLDEIVEGSGVANTLLEAAEVSSALGGVYLKVDWDTSIAPRPFLAAVHADAAVPEFRWGQLVAVTFWRVLVDTGAVVLRLLERHEPGRIEFGVYEGTRDNLGRVVPLTDRDVPADVQALTDGLDESGNAKPTGIGRLTAGYVPNMRPNRRFRGSDHGRSDLQGIEDLLDSLDETWTSWMRDLRLGRGRLVVPEGFLDTGSRGQGASFDADREVFAALRMDPSSMSGAGITNSQFEIRVEEHARTAQEIVAQAVAIAGYSAQSFGLASEVAVTATEVAARERKSFITRDKKSRYFAPVVADLLEVMLLLDRQLGLSRVEAARPQVLFADTVSEDPQRTATTLELLARAQAISTETKVRRANPDWDDEAVNAEVARIQAEAGTAVPDPVQAGTLV